MATRPVFVPGRRRAAVDIFMTEFTWNSGLSVAQKRRNIRALHQAHCARFPQARVLEISSKSEEPLGVALSAFHLPKTVPGLPEPVPLECVFQGGKVFRLGGPYTDLYTRSPREAKSDPRLRESGELVAFSFDHIRCPLLPRTAFYNWLYINALLESPHLGKVLEAYDGFTDIEFNPAKSFNCQAEAAALYVSLSRSGLLEQCRDFASFLQCID